MADRCVLLVGMDSPIARYGTFPGVRTMVHAAINLAVDDVRRSSRFYQTLLGCSSPMPAGSEHRDLFDLIKDADGTVVLILSRWGHSPLPSLQTKPLGPPGHGVSLFFVVPDFEDCWARAQSLQAEVFAPPHPSRGFEVPELTVVDPDGYFVTLSAGVKP